MAKSGVLVLHFVSLALGLRKIDQQNGGTPDKDALPSCIGLKSVHGKWVAAEEMDWSGQG